MSIPALILWPALLLNPYWVIVKNGQYLVDGSDATDTSLSAAKQFTSQADAQAYTANMKRHNPMATWAVQEVSQ